MADKTDKDWLKEDIEKLFMDVRTVRIMAKEILGADHSTVSYLKEAEEALYDAQL